MSLLFQTLEKYILHFDYKSIERWMQLCQQQQTLMSSLTLKCTTNDFWSNRIIRSSAVDESKYVSQWIQNGCLFSPLMLFAFYMDVHFFQLLHTYLTDPKWIEKSLMTIVKFELVIIPYLSSHGIQLVEMRKRFECAIEYLFSIYVIHANTEKFFIRFLTIVWKESFLFSTILNPICQHLKTKDQEEVYTKLFLKQIQQLILTNNNQIIRSFLRPFYTAAVDQVPTAYDLFNNWLQHIISILKDTIFGFVQISSCVIKSKEDSTRLRILLNLFESESAITTATIQNLNLQLLSCLFLNPSDARCLNIIKLNQNMWLNQLFEQFLNHFTLILDCNSIPFVAFYRLYCTDRTATSALVDENLKRLHEYAEILKK